MFSFGEEAIGTYIDEEGNLYECLFVNEKSFFAREECLYLMADSEETRKWKEYWLKKAMELYLFL